MWEASAAAIIFVMGFLIGYIVQLILFVRDKSIVRLGEGQVIVTQDFIEKIQKRHKSLEKLKQEDDEV